MSEGKGLAIMYICVFQHHWT